MSIFSVDVSVDVSGNLINTYQKKIESKILFGVIWLYSIFILMNTTTHSNNHSNKNNNNKITKKDMFKEGVTEEFVIQEIVKQETEKDLAQGIHRNKEYYIKKAHEYIETALLITNKGFVGAVADQVSSIMLNNMFKQLNSDDEPNSESDNKSEKSQLSDIDKTTHSNNRSNKNNNNKITKNNMFKEGVTEEFVIQNIVKQETEKDLAQGIHLNKEHYIKKAHEYIETALLITNKGFVGAVADQVSSIMFNNIVKQLNLDDEPNSESDNKFEKSQLSDKTPRKSK
jgi:flagellar biosynthesis protein FliP